MAKIRVYEVAKTLNVESKRILDWFSGRGQVVRSASSVLTQEQERAVRTAFSASGRQAGLSRTRQENRSVGEVSNQILESACICCGNEGMPVPKANAPEDLPVQKPRICLVCSKHLGNDASALKRKSEAHIEMLRSANSATPDSSSSA